MSNKRVSSKSPGVTATSLKKPSPAKPSAPQQVSTDIRLPKFDNSSQFRMNPEPTLKKVEPGLSAKDKLDKMVNSHLGATKQSWLASAPSDTVIKRVDNRDFMSEFN